MHSRVAAGLLLAMSIITVALPVRILLFGGVLLVGRLIVWVVMSGMSYRALTATRNLHAARLAAATA